MQVYDTSGPWGDPDHHRQVKQGLPFYAKSWILERGDVESYQGRDTTPIDDGYLSDAHARKAEENGRMIRFDRADRSPLRACKGNPVTQLHYAREGMITPEMEFIAIRENTKLQQAKEAVRMNANAPRNSLLKQHPGQAWGAKIPNEITPEFVRKRWLEDGPSSLPTSIIQSWNR